MGAVDEAFKVRTFSFPVPRGAFEELVEGIQHQLLCRLSGRAAA